MPLLKEGISGNLLLMKFLVRSIFDKRVSCSQTGAAKRYPVSRALFFIHFHFGRGTVDISQFAYGVVVVFSLSLNTFSNFSTLGRMTNEQ